MKLTKDQLVATVAAVKGTTFATLETSTVPEMRKTGNPFIGRVRKISKGLNVQIGAIYENAVNRQAEREGNPDAGEFVAEKLAYGSWLVPHKIIEHKGAFQIRVTCNPHMKPSEVIYTLDGEPVNDETLAEIKAFEPEKKGSGRQADFGVEREVVPRNYKLDSIVSIKINGTLYRIEG
jgi:hypothetical protein